MLPQFNRRGTPRHPSRRERFQAATVNAIGTQQRVLADHAEAINGNAQLLNALVQRVERLEAARLRARLARFWARITGLFGRASTHIGHTRQARKES